jgi:16S rRNA (adenine1518-N6/adenine1519-N6)-dimethyltransferase
VEIVRSMPPSVFWPRPKVSSAIVHVRLVDAWRERIADLDFFHGFVRAMFFHRRKLLRRELLSAFKRRLDKPAVDAILAEAGLAAKVRAEELDVATMLRLCDVVRQNLPD